MSEAAIAQVDPHMGRTWFIGLKEHEIAWTRSPDRPAACVELGIRGARDVQAPHGKHVLDVARAVKSRGARPAENVGRPNEAQSAARQARSNLRGVRKEPAGKLSHVHMILALARLGNLLLRNRCRPLGDIRAQRGRFYGDMVKGGGCGSKSIAPGKHKRQGPDR